jgi:hypothetical protein
MKAEKSMTVTSDPYGQFGGRGAADDRNCLAQIGLIRTGIGAFSAGILNTGRAVRLVYFQITKVITKSRDYLTC